MKTLAIPALVAAVWLGLPASAPADAAADFQKLLADVASFSEKPPLLALPPGVDMRYSKRLEDVSAQRFRDEEASLSAFAGRLRAIDRRGFTPAETLDALILERRLRDRLEELRFRAFETPIGSREGFHFAMATLADQYAFDRRGAVRRVHRQAADVPRAHERSASPRCAPGLASGRTLPRDVLAGYEQTIAPQVVDDAEAQRAGTGPSRGYPRRSRRPTASASGATVAAIRESAIPGFRDFLDFLRGEYIPRARTTLGLTPARRGRLLPPSHPHAHHTRAHADEVHETGQREVARIRAEMEAAIRRAGLQGNASRSSSSSCRIDPRFNADSPTRNTCRRWRSAAKRMDGALPRLFSRLPRTPYGIRPMPERIATGSRPATTTTATPTAAGGFVNINTSDLKARPLYVASRSPSTRACQDTTCRSCWSRENEGLLGRSAASSESPYSPKAGASTPSASGTTSASLRTPTAISGG